MTTTTSPSLPDKAENSLRKILWRSTLAARDTPIMSGATTTTTTTTTGDNGGPLLRHALAKRHMRRGAVAGTAVGVVVGVALLIFCLYPFVVHFIKQRRRRRGGEGGGGGGQDASEKPFDPEAGIAATKPSESDGPIDRAQRVSTSSSFQRNGHLPRGQLAEPPNVGLGWPPPATLSQGFHGYDGNDGWMVDPAQNYRVKAAPFPQLGCYDGEFAPPVSEDDQPGVLKGTNADYYSPSIPSEAFGMVTEPELPLDLESSTRKSSRGSSFRHHILSMFHHKGSRDQTMISISQSIAEEPYHPNAAPHAYGGAPLQPIVTNDRQVESPVNISPTSSNFPTPPALATDAALGSPPPAVEGAKTPPETTALAFSRFKAAPSPPHPAPGTVNPMDIMPASTESEQWYRTEHQLYASSYEMSPGKPIAIATPEPVDEPFNEPFMPPSSPTPPEDENHVSSLLTPPPNHIPGDEWGTKQEFPIMGQVVTAENIPRTNNPIILAPDGRNASYLSEQSTPFLGHGFTDVSSQNTPSTTQLDTPSPESGGSSYYRLSASPQPGHGASYPRSGVYHCDEPGCNQMFDQPHKLKHHQRYHSKDHKCLYPGCGKGFGTKTHLQRHINDRHEKKKKFHCSVPGCDYSRTGGKAFPRKDNWKRHMIKIHNIDQQQLPEPIEADLEMGGL